VLPVAQHSQRDNAQHALVAIQELAPAPWDVDYGASGIQRIEQPDFFGAFDSQVDDELLQSPAALGDAVNLTARLLPFMMTMRHDRSLFVE